MALNILLVEDNPGDVVLIQRAFRIAELDYLVTAKTDADEGWDHLQRAEQGSEPLPELILLDVNLPGVSGHELCERLKSHATLRTIPVIMLSSSSSPSDIRTAYENHANSYVTKPIDLAGLYAFVRQVEAYWFTLVNRPTT